MTEKVYIVMYNGLDECDYRILAVFATRKEAEDFTCDGKATTAQIGEWIVGDTQGEIPFKQVYYVRLGLNFGNVESEHIGYVQVADTHCGIARWRDCVDSWSTISPAHAKMLAVKDRNEWLANQTESVWHKQSK